MAAVDTVATAGAYLFDMGDDHLEMMKIIIIQCVHLLDRCMDGTNDKTNVDGWCRCN